MRDLPGDQRTFKLYLTPRARSLVQGGTLTLPAHKDAVEETWLTEKGQYNNDAKVLTDNTIDDLQLTNVEEPKKRTEAKEDPKNMSRKNSASYLNTSSKIIEGILWSLKLTMNMINYTPCTSISFIL